MRSLSAHLSEPGGHGHLPFHAGCTVCRAGRLSGPLPGDELIGQRPRALLAAALLAAATAAPAIPAIAPSVAVAQDERDDEGGDGGGEPERKGFGDEGGFEETPEAPLPADLGSPPAEPTPSASPAPSPQPPPTPIPTPPVSPIPAPAPGSDSTPPPARDNDPARLAPPSPRAVQPDGDRERSDAREKRASPAPSERPRAPSTPPNDRVEPPAAPTPPQPPADAPPAATPSAPPPSSVADAEAVQPGNVGGSYRVQSGESLWSIAQARLGADASPAVVARLVNRLWELNAGRIATGDPDLIMVGTLLRLP